MCSSIGQVILINEGKPLADSSSDTADGRGLLIHPQTHRQSVEWQSDTTIADNRLPYFILLNTEPIVTVSKSCA